MFLQRAEVWFQDLYDGSQLSVTPFLGDQTSSGRHWKNMVHIHTWSQHTHSHRIVGMGKGDGSRVVGEGVNMIQTHCTNCQGTNKN